MRGSREDGVTGATLVSHPDGYPKRRAAGGADVTTETVDVGGVFYGIGHTPNTGFLERTSVPRDRDGYILTQPNETGRMTTETTVEGIFAVGDVADPRYRQVITAAGTGCMAALDAEGFLETLGETERPAIGASA